MTNDHVRNMTPNLDALPENDYTKNKYHSSYGTERYTWENILKNVV